MASLVTVPELLAYFDGTLEADAPPEVVRQMTAMIEAISDDIEDAAGVPLEAGAGTVILAGTWDRDLILPAGPIRDVTAVSIDGVALPAGSYWYNDRALIRRGVAIPSIDGIQTEDPMNPPQGAQWRDGSSWGGPASTVVASLSWGYAVVPGFLKSLLYRVVARTYGNPTQIYQESLGSYSVMFQPARESDSHLNASERRRLRRSLGARTAGTFTVTGR